MRTIQEYEKSVRMEKFHNYNSDALFERWNSHKDADGSEDRLILAFEILKRDEHELIDEIDDAQSLLDE